MKTKLPVELAQKQHALLSDVMRGVTVGIGNLSQTVSVLAYGSTGYGFNPNDYGKLDDVDLFVFAPQREVSDIPKLLTQVVDGSIDYHQWHFNGIGSTWEIARFYGEYRGVKVGFRVMSFEDIVSRCSIEGARNFARAVSDIGVENRITGTSVWSIRHRKYRYVRFQRKPAVSGSHKALVVSQAVLSGRGTYLGTLGRKVLSGRPVFDPSGQLQESVCSLWQTYIQQTRVWHPKCAPNQIIRSIYRHERFSGEHTRRLEGIIRAC
jgi:hypothetical protein